MKTCAYILLLLICSLGSRKSNAQKTKHLIIKQDSLLQVIDNISNIRKLNLDSAYTLSEKCYSTATQWQFSRGIALSLFALAECNRKLKKYSLSIEQHLKASRLLKAEGLDSISADCFLNIGIMYTNQGDYFTSENYYRQTIEIFRKMPEFLNGKRNEMHFNGMVKGYYYLWTNSYYSGTYQKSISILDTIEMLRKKQGRIDANNLNNYGVTFLKMELPDSAIFYFKKGLLLAKEQRRPDLQLLFLSNIGIQLEKKGFIDAAMKNYDEMIRLGDSSNNKRMFAEGELAKARLLLMKGDRVTAVKLYLDAIYWLEQYGSEEQYMFILQEFANYHFSRKNFIEAENYFQLALNKAYKTKNNNHIAHILWDLSRLYLETNRFEESWNVLKQSREKAFQSTSQKLISYTGIGICNLLLSLPEKGDLLELDLKNQYGDSAIIFYQQALNFALTDTNRVFQASIYSSQGRHALLHSNYRKAIEYFHASMSLWEKLEHRSDYIFDLKPLAICFQKLGNSDSAIYYLQKFITKHDSLTDETRESLLRDLEVKYETKRKEQQIILLDRENRLSTLELKNRITEFNEQKLKNLLKDKEVDMAKKLRDLKSLELIKTQSELERKRWQILQEKRKKLLWKNESLVQSSLASRHKLFRNLIILSSLMLLSAVLFLFYRYRIKQHRKEWAERQRISGDLHDELGSTLSSIRMYSSYALDELQSGKKQDVSDILKIISESSEEMIDKMNDLIWAINPSNDSFSVMIERLQAHFWRLTQSQGIHLNTKITEAVLNLELPLAIRRNLYLIAKELLTNAIKHASCSEIKFDFYIEENMLHLCISDNGKGMQWPQEENQRIDGGHGWQSIQSRILEIGASFDICTSHINGTRICISKPLK